MGAVNSAHLLARTRRLPIRHTQLKHQRMSHLSVAPADESTVTKRVLGESVISVRGLSKSM